jgi:hypothetical protein
MQALLLTATYVVVVFSVAIQGTTVDWPPAARSAPGRPPEAIPLSQPAGAR